MKLTYGVRPFLERLWEKAKNDERIKDKYEKADQTEKNLIEAMF